MREVHAGAVAVDELVEAYQAAWKINERAERFSIYRTTVMEHPDHRGTTRRQQGLTDAQTRESARLYPEGCSLARLGKRYDVDAKTVRTVTAERGVEIRARRGWSKSGT